MSEFLFIASIHFLALISPGPDLVMALQTSMKHGARSTSSLALGFALGMIVHVSYCILGIGLIISKSIVLFSIIKLAGAIYLAYLGIKMVLAKHSNTEAVSELKEAITEPLPTLEAIKRGFLTNILNPKVTLFVFTLFTQVISQNTGLAFKLAISAEMALATFLWFSSVGLLLSRQVIRTKFNKIQPKLDKVFGSLLILLGIKVALSNK